MAMTFRSMNMPVGEFFFRCPLKFSFKSPFFWPLPDTKSQITVTPHLHSGFNGCEQTAIFFFDDSPSQE
jgi:hypothetical protein